ncbi:hypothetical protein Syun_000799 [Stephania yunnanensis]|uniref:Uncharacterized protein n=1 Tax=Stephania yunnanensis TaxID=152371 RepID=A0AAP0LGM6_9MAGN
MIGNLYFLMSFFPAMTKIIGRSVKVEIDGSDLGMSQVGDVQYTLFHFDSSQYLQFDTTVFSALSSFVQFN